MLPLLNAFYQTKSIIPCNLAHRKNQYPISTNLIIQNLAYNIKPLTNLGFYQNNYVLDLLENEYDSQR
jgi:hypothetical protein